MQNVGNNHRKDSQFFMSIKFKVNTDKKTHKSLMSAYLNRLMNLTVNF